MNLINGDSLQILKRATANSVDAVVTDPPYGLSFMGKKWDYDLPSVEIWRQAHRVLKPGGHLLSFGGTRTYHRLVCAIEEAGFEIRDQLQWIYGSGFPKSLDVSKAIDKAAGAEREVVGPNPNGRPNMVRVDAAVLQPRVDAPITAPSTPDAIKWQGWGTALKPANEPIVLARKPLSESTVAKNVLKWGVGALNVDASRIAGEYKNQGGGSFATGKFANSNRSNTEKDGADFIYGSETQGRWPANVLFDETAAEMLDEQSGISQTLSTSVGFTGNNTDDFFKGKRNKVASRHNDKGGASRFFYVAKASKRERGEGNAHPTVKPIKLMEYLCRLITPPGGIILDPFMGSGTTGVAAKRLGFEFIGIEMNEEYLEIARRRIEHVKNI